MTDKATLSKYLRKVTGDLRDAQRRIDELERRAAEPLAIVGIACRFPGGVHGAEELWELVASGTDATGPFPQNRGWPLDTLFDPDPDRPGTTYSEEAGFVHDAGDFDAAFFGISPRDALAMDPQQRLLLEAAWEAIEDAGIDPATLAGSATGIFAGVMHREYGVGVDRADLEGHRIVGSSPSVLSGRVSYTLGLEGPAVTIDTACSSSLVTIHLAGQALRGGECDLALAGGVTVMSDHRPFVEYSRQRVLAPDGRSKAFAAAADGVGWAEGVGVLLLERLADARRNGREVLAVVRGSAVNQDGASNGITAPNGPSQERVIRQALASAGLGPAEVDAVEAHGTGTPLGDPIEAQALLATYGQERGDFGPLRLGGIKSNFGHAQAAAGVAGVIKMTMALRREELPPTLHVDEPTPHVDWSAGEVELLTEAQPWPRGERPRRAGVSSFGVSGTNAHVILEEAPVADPAPAVAAAVDSDGTAGGDGDGPADGGEATEGGEATGPAAIPLVLSAKSEPALRGQAESLAAHLRRHPELEPLDVAASLATARSRFDHRAAAIGGEREELLEALDALAAGRAHGGLRQARVASGRRAFLFPGQGSQWWGMGRRLLAESPFFAARFEECAAALEPFLDYSVAAVARGDDGAPQFDSVAIVQPTLFATTVSLARLWEHHGVRPEAVVGHSQGEIAAAHLAGALSLEDAARVVALRSQLALALTGKGGVAAVALAAEELEPRLERWDGRVTIGAINGPQAVVVSGIAEPLRELLDELAEEGVRTREILPGWAGHSPEVEPIREQVLERLEPVRPRPAELPIYSAMRAGTVAGEELDAEYWYRSMREPVNFRATIEAMLGDGFEAFLESTPHPVLGLAVQETAEVAKRPVRTIGTLRRDEGGPERFLAALAEAHVNGAELDWARLFPGGRRVALPTYAFQRERFWLEPGDGATDANAIGLAAADHPLLGAATSVPGEAEGEEEWLFTGRLSLRAQPWLGDHRVYETAILPGTAFVEMALKAAEHCGAEELEELTIESPLVLPEEGAVRVQLRLGAAEETGRRALSIHSRPEAAGEEEPWTVNARGAVGPGGGEEPEPLAEWPPRGAQPLALEEVYDRAIGLGVDYGPAFQCARAAWSRGEEVFVETELDPDRAAEAERFELHPALLDACFHPQLAQGDGGAAPRAPFSWQGVRLHRAGASLLRVALVPRGESTVTIAITDPAGEPVATVRSLVVRPLAPEALAQAGGDEHRDSLFAIEWLPCELPEAREGAEPAAVVELVPDPELDAAAAAQALTLAALQALQEAIAAGEEARLAIVTRGAVAVGPDEAPDPAAAALRGLVRSAQAEHPGRFLFVDSDGSEGSARALEQLLASAAFESEPRLALREGAAFAPRLRRAGGEPVEPRPFDPERTAVVSGGTSGLGALFARHLVAEHGARQLLLLSRRGSEAPGAEELRAELEALGATVTIAACDVGDRDQLALALATVPAEHPVGSVFHAAAVFDNALVATLEPERLRRVLAAKADAAWHLHELTGDEELSDFVLFSSANASFHNPGQANYAAANAFLEGLAQQRRGAGLAGSAIAWGGWATEASGTLDRLGEVDRARIERSGFLPISAAVGAELFERTRALPAAVTVAAPLDLAALRARARDGELEPIYAGIVRLPKRRAAAGSLATRLAAVEEAEREALVVALVAEHAAAVLGHGSAADVDPKAAFKELGFDSLGAVELRNRLAEATGMQLPSTMVFDHPNVEATAGFLLGLAAGQRPAAAPVRVTARSEEPIAIVGMSCRYPGGVSSPAQLWRLLQEGGDGISPFPGDRDWDLDTLFDPDPDRPGTTYATEGGFVEGATEFDAAFFGISPREAAASDPQQRLLLEAAWEALEDAGVDPTGLAGSATGVFAGVMHHDYRLSAGGAGARTGYDGETSGGSIVTGRVAYALGLEGPAVSVDTACSSSLVAMHLAGQALRSGECELALAGGISISSTPGMYVMFSHQRGLAPDGRCKPFAAAADGTGVSEGVGLVVLERLSDARRNGHEILAVIRGSATNQDGASNGLTAPNGPSQERVIRQALANAGLEPSEVDAVEAHGTGTTLGDPIEAQALLSTYGQERGENAPLYLGAIKSNIGHTQAAAGVAGVIKMAMAMREGVLPKTLHLDEPTPHVDWSAGEVELLSEAQEWAPQGRPRRAGVSSFGLSGTNAHLILEEAPEPAGADRPGEPGGEGVTNSSAISRSTRHTGGDAEQSDQLPTLPFVLSAKSEPALQDQALRLAAHLQASPGQGLHDTAFSLATTRAQLSHRAAITAASQEQLLEALGALATGKPHPSLTEAKAREGKLAFLLSGQGAQRPRMGKGLYEAFPVYAQALDEACEALDQHLGLSLKGLLFAMEGSKKAQKLDRTEITQPALFATELALYRLLESFGYQPDYLLGHSIGELTAAHIAGVFDLPDAARLICARGALMGALPEGGAMVAIEATEEELGEEGLPDGVSLAGVNGPTSVVVSGEEQAVEALAEQWKEKGRKATRLNVSHAFHSALMDPMLHELEQVAREITLSPPKLAVISNLTGEPLDAEQATDPSYWAAQVRGTVRFAAGVSHLLAQGTSVCLEIGPGTNLCAAAGATFAAADGSFAGAGTEATAIPTLRKDADEAESLIAAIAAAHAHGASPKWKALLPSAKRAPLPTYAFQRQRYWLEPVAGAGDAAAVGQGASDHPLLAAAISTPGLGEGEESWLLTGRLARRTHPWLADHQLHGTAILPGTAFVEMALEAARLAGAGSVAELTIEAPLALPEHGAIQVQVSVAAADEEGGRRISIHSRPESADEGEPWSTNATGVLLDAVAEPEPLTEWPPAGAEALPLADVYERAAEFGVDYGPAFQGAKTAWARGSELFVEVELDPEQAGEAERFGLHPALLDAAFHPMLVRDGGSSNGDGPEVPFSWGGVSLQRPGGAELRVAIDLGGEGAALRIADPAGDPVASVAELVARPLPASQLAGAGAEDGLMRLDWVPAELDAEGEPARLVECEPRQDLDPAAAALALAEAVLASLREALAADEARVAFQTRGAVAALAGESADPAAAAVWGLVRSAQAEHPGRFLLLDSDGSEASAAALERGLAQAAEPQLALRDGAALAPRLARAARPDPADAPPLDPERTVLVTGATGTVGAIVARHLATAHGARRLLLVSRRGPEAPGAAELRAELESLGAEVELAACDAADRAALEAMLAAIPPERPLGAVFHAAGVLDDALVEALAPEQLERVLAAKATVAWNLHELTAGAELTDFCLFSSAAGTFSSPAQANYAAANAFLDALAQQRAAAGLPAAAIAWGAWLEESEMTAQLSAADRARLLRGGIRPLPVAEGLELFDRARAAAAPFQLAVGLDRAGLRAQARDGALPPLFAGLVRLPARRAAAADSLARRLATVPEDERPELATGLVLEHVAALLGHPSAAAVDPKATFKDLGFDSLGAVELRNRLSRATGLRLPPTLVFDYPTSAEVGAHLCDLADPGAAAGAEVDESIDRLAELLGRLDEEEREGARSRLRSLLSEGYAAGADADEVERIRGASAEEILRIVNDEMESK